MLSVRQRAVKKAKKMGICTQCLKHPATEARYQCQRCIDTNRRKQKMRLERPEGMSDEDWKDLSEKRAYDRKKKNAQRSRERYHRIKAERGGVHPRSKGSKQQPRNGKLFIMTDEHKAKIAMGVARAKAQRDARKATMAKQDSEPLVTRGKYKKRVPVAPIQMAGMVNDLERFIANMKIMSAHEYLEAREELIISIIKRGVNVNG
jgi:hypothetical protein